MRLQCTAVIITNLYDAQCKKAIASVSTFAELLILDNTPSGIKNIPDHPHSRILSIGKHSITDFSAVRNTALAEASYDWVFFLDSDEVLQKFDTTIVHKAIKSSSTHGYWISRSDIFLGKKIKYGEAGNQLLLRLVQKHYTTFTGRIHEVAQVSGNTKFLPLYITHSAHTSLSHFLDDIVFYASQIGAYRNSSKKTLIFELLTYPPAKFLYTYLWKRGFLDGYRGLIYAITMSIHSLTVRATAYEQTTT